MAILFLAVFVFSAWGVHFRRRDLELKFLSRDFCDAVKGICICLVFIRHVWPYVEIAGYVSPCLIAKIGSVINGSIGQLLVAPFLFFSGFGVMESVRNKGVAYVRAMPKRRLLSTMLNFDIAVLLFAALAFFFGRKISINRILLAFVGWSDVGNSNWYIFDIVILYALFWMTFAVWYRFSRTDGTAFSRALDPVVSVTVLSILMSLVLRCSGKNGYWFNTILCFPAGVWFSFYSQFLLKQASSSLRFWTIFIVSAVAFCVAHALSRTLPPLFGNAGAVLFSWLGCLFVGKTTYRKPCIALAWAESVSHLHLPADSDDSLLPRQWRAICRLPSIFVRRGVFCFDALHRGGMATVRRSPEMRPR